MYVCPGLRLKYTGLRIVMYLFGTLPDAQKHYSTSRNYCLVIYFTTSCYNSEYSVRVICTIKVA